jgi:hypothetical protein
MANPDVAVIVVVLVHIVVAKPYARFWRNSNYRIFGIDREVGWYVKHGYVLDAVALLFCASDLLGLLPHGRH